MAKRCQAKLVEEKASTTTEEDRKAINVAPCKVGGRYTFTDKGRQNQPDKGSNREGTNATENDTPWNGN